MGYSADAVDLLLIQYKFDKVPFSYYYQRRVGRNAGNFRIFNRPPNLIIYFRLPPGLWGFPIVGSGLTLDRGNLPPLFTKCMKKYGDTFSLSVPIHQDIIVVSL